MKYEVQQYTLCQGWINCWHIIDGDGKETPQVFDTEEDAQAELEEFLAEIAKEIFHGERAANEGYDPSEFRIEPVALSSEPPSGLRDSKRITYPVKQRCHLEYCVAKQANR